MRKLILILLSLSFSLVMYSQTTADAVKRMNNGQYDVAKTYWEALNDNYNSYGAKISLCNACIVLQKEAKSLVSKQYYTKAIAVYQQILAKNPTDQNAKSQIVICQRLRDEYNQANRLNTYTNETYGYSSLLRRNYTNIECLLANKKRVNTELCINDIAPTSKSDKLWFRKKLQQKFPNKCKYEK